MSVRKYLTRDFLLLVLMQYIGFKLSWLATAWGAVEGPPYSYYGAFAFIAFVGLHILYSGRKWELWFALAVGAFGTCLDSTYAITGLIDYNGTYPGLPFVAPIWITAMWMGLAVTLDHSLKVLVGRPLWIFLTGAIFGPLAHWSGHSMGAITVHMDFWTTMAVLSVPWGLGLVISYRIMEYFRPTESSSEQVLQPAES